MIIRFCFYLIGITILFGCKPNDSKIDYELEKEHPHIKRKSEIIGNWILTTGFNDQNMVFLKEEKIDTNEQWLKQFTFKSNKLSFSYLRARPRCGNGLETIDSCFWRFTDDKIEMYIAGHEIGYRFVNHSIYRQKPSLKHEIILTRDSVIKSEYENLFDVEFN